MGRNVVKNHTSIALQRGKNNKVDAERIAFYAMKNDEEAVGYKRVEPLIKSETKCL